MIERLGYGLLGFLMAIGLILLFWDKIDCLVYPGTDWCLGCVEDCLDPLVKASK